jgi:hypothetical protein
MNSSEFLTGLDPSTDFSTQALAEGVGNLVDPERPVIVRPKLNEDRYATSFASGINLFQNEIQSISCKNKVGLEIRNGLMAYFVME